MLLKGRPGSGPPQTAPSSASEHTLEDGSESTLQRELTQVTASEPLAMAAVAPTLGPEHLTACDPSGSPACHMRRLSATHAAGQFIATTARTRGSASSVQELSDQIESGGACQMIPRPHSNFSLHAGYYLSGQGLAGEALYPPPVAATDPVTVAFEHERTCVMRLQAGGGGASQLHGLAVRQFGDQPSLAYTNVNQSTSPVLNSLGLVRPAATCMSTAVGSATVYLPTTVTECAIEPAPAGIDAVPPVTRDLSVQAYSGSSAPTATSLDQLLNLLLSEQEYCSDNYFTRPSHTAASLTVSHSV